MTWTLGQDQARGPAPGEAIGSSVYYGPTQNGSRREWGIPPANGRNMPSTYPTQTGIGGRTVTQPVLNGQTRVPWHVAPNGTTNELGIASPNGFGHPLQPAQFSQVMQPRDNGMVE